MALDNTKLLLRLVWQPAGAMSGILDQGSLLFASIAVLLVALLLQFSMRPLVPQTGSGAVFKLMNPQATGTQVPGAEQDEPVLHAAHAQPWWRFSFYTPLLVLAIVYVPGTLVATNLLARLGGLGAVFERDYASLLTCASMAWAAVNMPLVLVARVVPLPVLGAVAVLAYFYFAVLMFFAVRTVFGTENGVAAASVGLSVIPLAGAVVVWGPLRFVMGWLASPFFLFYAFYYLGSEFRTMGAGLRRGQNFRRMLEAAAVNPHDADAQYQLGLIHQQRRQYSAAVERFKRAVAIDPTETDAHFQLGRMAREQGRLDDALAHFQAVLKQDEKHNLSEIHREIGATFLARGQYEDARRELAIYLDRRPYDPEGLYHYGQTLERSGDIAQAREMYVRAVEAARTAPRYRRRYTARWSRLAQKQRQKLAQRS